MNTIPAITRHRKKIWIALACLSALALSWLMISRFGLGWFKVPPIIDLAGRKAMSDSRDRDFWRLLISTAMVSVGVLMEGPELVIEIIELARRKSRERKNLLVPSLYRKEPRKHEWLKILGTIGWLLILVGVGGEGIYEGLIGPKDSAIKVFDDALVTAALNKAEAVSRKADALDARLTIIGNALNDMGEDVRALGPRWKLLEQEQGKIVDALKPFPNTELTIFVCSSEEDDDDKLSMWMRRLAGEARWLNHPPKTWDCPPHSQSTIYFASSQSEGHTQSFWEVPCSNSDSPKEPDIERASKALCRALNEAGIDTEAWAESTNDTPQHAEVFFEQLNGGPSELPLMRPAIVVLSVTKHPATTGRHKSAAKPRK